MPDLRDDCPARRRGLSLSAATAAARSTSASGPRASTRSARRSSILRCWKTWAGSAQRAAEARMKAESSLLQQSSPKPRQQPRSGGPGPWRHSSARASASPDRARGARSRRCFCGALLRGGLHLSAHGLLLALAIGIALALVLGVPAATIVERESGRTDPGFVVIDEVAGQWIALLGQSGRLASRPDRAGSVSRSSISPSRFPCGGWNGCPAAGASSSTMWPPACMLWV